MLRAFTLSLLLYNKSMEMETENSQIDQTQSLPHTEETALLHGNRDLAVLYSIASQLNRKVEVREML